MWFLLVQIFILLTLATLLGAIATYFFIRNRYEDVTESHSHLLATVNRLGDPQSLLTRHDFDERLSAFGRPDLSPVEDRLQAMENGLNQMSLRVNAIRNTDINPVSQGIANLQADVKRIPRPDLAPIEMSIQKLERSIAALKFPEADLDPLSNQVNSVHHSLSQMIDAIGKGQSSETAFVKTNLSALSTAVSKIDMPDLEPVMDGIVALDDRFDLRALENRLTSIEYGLAAVHDMLRSKSTALAGRSEIRSLSKNARADQPNTDKSISPPAPSRPPRDKDPINPMRKPGRVANLLSNNAFGPADDLTQIEGIGPILKELLNDIGIFYFWQIAEWTPDEITAIDEQLLQFKGRIARDGWVNRGRILASLPSSAKRPIAARV